MDWLTNRQNQVKGTLKSSREPPKMTMHVQPLVDKEVQIARKRYNLLSANFCSHTHSSSFNIHWLSCHSYFCSYTHSVTNYSVTHSVTSQHALTDLVTIQISVHTLTQSPFKFLFIHWLFTIQHTLTQSPFKFLFMPWFSHHSDLCSYTDPSPFSIHWLSHHSNFCSYTDSVTIQISVHALIQSPFRFLFIHWPFTLSLIHISEPTRRA